MPAGLPDTNVVNFTARPRQLSTVASNTPISIVIGRDRVKCPPFVIAVDEDTGNLIAGFSICVGEIEDIEKVFFNGVDVTDNSDGLLTLDGAVVTEYTGTADQAVDSSLVSVIDGYDDAHAGKAYVVLTVPPGSSTGFPRVECIVRGLKVIDFTKGGSLSGRPGDAWAARNQTVPSSGISVDTFSIETWLYIGDVNTNTRRIFSYGTEIRVQIVANRIQFRTQHGGSNTIVLSDTRIYNQTKLHLACVANGSKLQVFINGELDKEEDYSGNITFSTNEVLSFGSDATVRLQEFRWWNKVLTQPLIYQTLYERVADDAADLLGVWHFNETSGTTASGAGSKTWPDLTTQEDFNTKVPFIGLPPLGITPTYSANPVICFAGLIQRFVPRFEIHWDSFLDAATYNDELLSGSPRRTVGLSMVNPSNFRQWMETFRAYMGCFIGYEDGKIRLTKDYPEVKRGGLRNQNATLQFGNNGNVASNSFSVELFVYFERNDDTQTTIFSKKQTVTTGNGWAIYRGSDNKIRFRVQSSITATVIADNVTTPDRWVHVAATVDRSADTIKLYIDQEEQDSAGIGLLGSLNSLTSMNIGAFDGRIDEIRIWNKALSDDDVELYKNTEVPNPYSDLRAYWRLNEIVDVGGTDVIQATAGLDVSGNVPANMSYNFGNPDILPEDLVAWFDENDIAEGTFRLGKKDILGTPNYVIVEYTDSISDDTWTKEQVHVRTQEVIDEDAPARITRINLPGIHKVSEATREGISRLNKMRLDTSCSMELYDEGILLQVGSIIGVSHSIGLKNKLFRVIGINTRQGRYKLDCIEYDQLAYSDEVVNALSAPDTYLGDPLGGGTTPGGGNFINAITNLELEEQLYVQGTGTTASRIRVSWDAVTNDFLEFYKVVGMVGGEVVFETTTLSERVFIPDVNALVGNTPVTYTVAVTSHTKIAESNPISGNINIVGKFLVPTDVPGITAERTGADSIILKWDKAIDIDLLRYEIRQGDVGDEWEDATTIDNLDGTELNLPNLTMKVHKFFVKAVDTVKNESEGAATVTIDISAPPPVDGLTGFEVGGEVHLRYEAPDWRYTARYKIEYSAVGSTNRILLDEVDSLYYVTTDILEGNWTLYVTVIDSAGRESTVETVDVEVTTDVAAFFREEHVFTQPQITDNFEKYTLRSGKEFWVTNKGESFSGGDPSSFEAFDNESLAGYTTTLTSDAVWLSENYDAGGEIGVDYTVVTDMKVLEGSRDNITIDIEVSNDNFLTETIVFSESVGGAGFRYARVRITVTGDEVIQFSSDGIRLYTKAIDANEFGEDRSQTTGGKEIILNGSYTVVRDVTIQPINTRLPLVGVVDNIAVGYNSWVVMDGSTVFLSADNSALDFDATTSFTIEFWCTPPTTGTRTILSKGYSNTTAGYNININSNGTVTVNLRDTGGSTSSPSTPSGAVSGTTHVAVVIDRANNNCDIYIDGTRRDRTSISTIDNVSNSFGLRVGAQSDNSSKYTGAIDELRIWAIARTPEQIGEDRNHEINAESSGLAGYWLFDGRLGSVVTTIRDETDNDTDLTKDGNTTLRYTRMPITQKTKVNRFYVYIFNSTNGDQVAADFKWHMNLS